MFSLNYYLIYYSFSLYYFYYYKILPHHTHIKLNQYRLSFYLTKIFTVFKEFSSNIKFLLKNVFTNTYISYQITLNDASLKEGTRNVE